MVSRKVFTVDGFTKRNIYMKNIKILWLILARYFDVDLNSSIMFLE